MIQSKQDPEWSESIYRFSDFYDINNTVNTP
jgi:hypothetical protein